MRDLYAGPWVRREAGKQKDLGSIPLHFSAASISVTYSSLHTQSQLKRPLNTDFKS